jgi:hypothetical protein
MFNPSNQMTGEQIHAMAPGGANSPMSQSNPAMPGGETPGMVTFAGTMLLLYGGFQIAWALVEFANAARITAAPYGNFGGFLWSWAILDVLFAGAALYAGYSVISGGRFGQVFGLILAGISAIRWFFYLPAAQWLGIVMIALDILIIYALVVHADYFAAKKQTVG